MLTFSSESVDYNYMTAVTILEGLPSVDQLAMVITLGVGVISVMTSSLNKPRINCEP